MVNKRGINLYKGRYTVENKEDIVVFIIGMRINKMIKPHRWIPTMKAMGPMLKELYQNRELGFLGGEILFSWRKITLIQYWSSFDKLEAYAHGEVHSKVWKDFYRNAFNNECVGIFHESFQVQAKHYEALYVNMPKRGLGKARDHVKVNKATNNARERLK